jgi:SNF2 family DNA or RNA helicase
MNKQIIISSLGSKQLLLTGNIADIKSNNWAMMYMRDYLDFTFKDENSIVIVVHESLQKSLDRINKLATKYINAEIIYDDSISSEVNNYKRIEKDFQEFSLKALKIRENECELSDLLQFKNSLIENMRSRTLYPLQLLSAYHLAFSQNACNFSVPGAGKTSVVYAAFTYLNNLPVDNPKHIDKILVIGPLSSFGPWEQEYFECFGFDANAKRLIGSISRKEKETYLYGSNAAIITLVSYQSVVTVKDDLISFVKRNKTMIVLDEAHKIKNTTGGIIASSVMELAIHANSRVVLTGTPAPNGYEDLFNLFKFIWPTKDILKFNINQLKNMSITSDESRVITLLDQIKPYFIRVKKGDLHIPEANFLTVSVPMQESQRVIYDTIEERFINELVNEIDKGFLSDISKAKMVRLMQAATNPTLLQLPLKSFCDENGELITESINDSKFIKKIMNYHKDEIPSKYIQAANIAQEIISNGGKVVIWATFIKNILSLKEYLFSKGIECKELYGATPVAKNDEDETEAEIETRESIVKEFNKSDSSFKIIIANPFAVAESISLHKACHNAIYLERSFNAAHFIQSKDRIHRYGLEPGTITNYYFLVSENSIDETINRRLNEKEHRLLEIIESMPIPLFNNVLANEGDDDIKAIISDYGSRIKTL